MAGKKEKSISFNAMVKFFMQSYGVPTKKDINKLHDKLDRIEKLIKSLNSAKRHARSISGANNKTSAGSLITASDVVVSVIRQSGSSGVDFATLKGKTGFEDKKIRNIIFRLDKTGRITRKSRGVYKLPEKVA